MSQQLIEALKDKCVGCNKCILNCPTHANIATLEDGQNKIEIQENLCISCGECIVICDHKSRDYNDDTDRFFQDLQRGEKISLVVAPAIRHNLLQYENLFGYLKNIGVNLIYDVSYGADITTWAYIKTIRDNHLNTVIAQPCPVVVQYIETFKPELIQYLAPVHSPALCAAIYLKKYKNCTDKIAFLSPCVGKETEFKDPNTNNNIEYNVTIAKIKEYLKKNNVNLASYPKTGFDNDEGSLGVLFSRPGGLKENVYFYMGDDTWVMQVEGIEHVKHYLDEYAQDVKFKRPVPILVDALNCANGCNIGTGTDRDLKINAINQNSNKLKKAVSRQKAEQLFEKFGENLNLEDFTRYYSDKSADYVQATAQEIEQVFQDLEKYTEEQKNINCFSCGYGNCKSFAAAVALGQNHKGNCIKYSRALLAKSLQTIDEMFDSLNNNLTDIDVYFDSFNKSAKDLQDISKHIKIVSINASIESARFGSQGASFGVIANEVKDLADSSSNLVNRNSEDVSIIKQEIKKIKDTAQSVKLSIDNTMSYWEE